MCRGSCWNARDTKTLTRLLHARLESFDLELASFDKVVDIEPSRRRILNRYVRLPALGNVSRAGLRSGLALLAGDITLCRHFWPKKPRVLAPGRSDDGQVTNY